VQHRKQQWK